MTIQRTGEKEEGITREATISYPVNLSTFAFFPVSAPKFHTGQPSNC